MRFSAGLAAVILMTGAPAAAAVETLLRAVVPEGDGATVELRLLNDGAEAVVQPLAPTLAAELDTPEGRRAVTLERAVDSPATVSIPAGGFAPARYRFMLPAGVAGARLSLAIPSLGTAALVFSPPGAAQLAAAGAPPAGATASGAASGATAADQSSPAENEIAESNAFLPNLSAYAPIYGVYGPGTDSDVRLQISFKYQLFGAPETDERRTFAHGLHFAYTQRMFWDVDASSSPFRNIDFMPELLYLTPVWTPQRGVHVSARIAARHESNGRSGAESRSLNMLYVQPRIVHDLGGSWRLTVAPRIAVYVGSLSDNPGIKHYRGNTGLDLALGADDGLRIGFSGRLNPGSGKGALDTDVSYPLDRLLGTRLNLYLYGQFFRGYGENLLDYDRLLTRARAGFAFVR